MPTAYLKKLAKLNHTTVNKLEKFWSQAKEIAKSEGQGKQWGLITTIFQNKLKKEGYKIKACSMSLKEYTNEVKEHIKKIFARGLRVQQEQYADNWTSNNKYIVSRCLKEGVSSEVCAKMLHIYSSEHKPFVELLKEANDAIKAIKNFESELDDFFAKKDNEMKKIIALNENRLDNSTKALYETMNEGSFQYNYRTDDDFSNFIKTTLSNEVVDVIRSNKPLIKKCVEKRSKTHSIVWDALTRIFLYVIKSNNIKVSLSYDKIKNWFKFNNTTFDVALKPVIEEVDGLREELRETEK